MTKTHVTVDPAALAIAKEIKENRKEYERQIKELREKHEREMDELDQKFSESHTNLWLNLTNTLKLPPSDSDTGFGYEMDSNYVENHGVLFLKEVNENADDCECEVCVERRGRGEPKGGTLRNMLMEALMGDRD